VPTEADYRLPRTVTPIHYELTLEPDLEAASFAGSMRVDVDVHEVVDEIVINAADLQIDRVELSGLTGETLLATSSYDETTERVTLTFDGRAGPGAWQLRADFRGVLNDELRGFYRAVYRDQNGASSTIAATQFEATDARRAFPCWDEPDLKATFDVTLIVADGLAALSNGAEVSRTPIGSGNTAVRFQTTMKMSTYLVAFVVGKLKATDPVDVDGVPLRVVFPPGKEGLTDFALEMGAFALRYYTEYYGIGYPESKLDMIAIPDFAWGAMENIGAIIYRETALLVDRERATQAELLRVAGVIAHEIAHMWFGDLVTMKWWNGIWLNEAFATFAEMKCVDAFRPEWKRWLSFAASRGYAMETDATAATRSIEIAVASPEDANAMFDSLTYVKGSSVLRMLEQFLGEEPFRAGLSAYLEQHAYGNTETADLWAALEAASGRPVGDIMGDWIFQGGFPAVVVEGGPGAYEISQHRFRYLGESAGAWPVPLVFSADGDRGVRLLAGPITTLPVPGPLIVNDGANGFYRVRYADGLFADVAGRLGDLDAPDRYAFVSDTWAGVLAGTVTASDFVGLLPSLRFDDEPDVWSVMLAGLRELDRIAEPGDRETLQRFVRDLVEPKSSELGWELRTGEADRSRRLRGLLLRTLGTLGADSATQARARAVRAQVTSDPESVDAEVADAALAVVAANGDMGDFNDFLRASGSTANPQHVVRFLQSAAAVPDDAAAELLFQLVLDRKVRSQDSFWLLARMLGQRDTGVGVWSLMKANWEAMLAVVPPTNGRHIIDHIPVRSEPDVASDIAAWLFDHPIRGGERFAKQQVELMNVRVGLREREASRLGGVLS
jgi:puromycin-sensitive aminopeptidase